MDGKKRAAFILILAAAAVCGTAARAEAKTAVKARLKGSTLTISGKGSMPAKLNVKNRKKVKKVVIKKGVTTIANKAFQDYKNLKSITIPNTVKKIGWSSLTGTRIKKLTVPPSVTSIGEMAFNGMAKLEKLTVPGDFSLKIKPGDESWYSVCDHVDTVEFNTKLNIERTALFTTENFIVKKNDPEYKSLDGVVYSRDGRHIVRVPFLKKELDIAEGCEEFNLQSVLYISQDAEGDPMGGCRVEKIAIPSSVKAVESDKFYKLNARDYYAEDSAPAITLDIKTKQLDGMSVNELQKYLKIDIKTMAKLLPEQIYYKDDMYLTTDGVLLEYMGNAREITIPQGVQKIGSYVFGRYRYTTRPLEKIVLPEGLIEIGDKAFYFCSDPDGKEELKVDFPSSLTVVGDQAFAGNAIKKLTLPDTISSYGKGVLADAGITELTLPQNMKKVPEGLCDGCHSLQKIVIPDSVETIGARAFADCRAASVQFGKSVKAIGNAAFAGVDFTRITLPATIEKIESEAFLNPWEDAPKNRTITIQGSSRGIEGNAFNGGDRLNYTKSPGEFRTFFDTIYASAEGKKVRVPVRWNQVLGADGYKAVFATDAKFKKQKKVVNLKKNKKKATVTLIPGKTAKAVYGKIRPYKKVDGRRVYGRWTKVKFQCV